jgi:hypothetical protein
MIVITNHLKRTTMPAKKSGSRKSKVQQKKAEAAKLK